MAWPNIYGLDSSSYEARPQPGPPTFLFVHDISLSSCHYTPLLNQMREAGYRTLLPQLPSSTDSYMANVVDQDVATIVEAAAPLLRTGMNLVMVMSGYGAVPGSMAARRINNWSLETPRAGRVIRCVHISSLLLQDGERVRDFMPFRSSSLEMLEDNMCNLSPTLSRMYFEPCSPNLLAGAISRRQTVNGTALITPVTTAAWATIPSLYIICRLDELLTPTVQEQMASRLQDNGHPGSAVLRLQSGHAPYLTDAAQMLAILERLAVT